MSIILYSTGCPKCNVLEAKLNSKSIKYEVCTDIEVMQSKGMMTAPNLEVDGKLVTGLEGDAEAPCEGSHKPVFLL